MSRADSLRLQMLAAAVLLLGATPARPSTGIEAYFVGDLLKNSTGGIKTGTAFLADAGLKLSSSLNAVFGEGDAEVFTYVLYNNHSTFSDRYTGDLQGVSNIDTIEALRLYELWYQQPISDDFSLRFGLYDLNSEFDAIDTAGFFINSSHGIGPDYAQSGENGPSIFPSTSLAARFDWAISESSTVRYALLDGVPGDPDHPARTTVQFGSGDGVLHALEYNYQSLAGARFGLGGWLYSANFDLVEPGPSRTTDDGNGGIYGFVDAPLYASDSGLEVAGFLRYGMANDDFNLLDSYIGAGAVLTGLVPSRPDDQLGIALASARVASPFRGANRGGFDHHETSIELSYSAQLSRWLRVQPDIQYIINPGADPAYKNALVLGLRFELLTSCISN